jgi:hypothetical protein
VLRDLPILSCSNCKLLILDLKTFVIQLITFSVGAVYMGLPLQETRCIQSLQRVAEQLMDAVKYHSVDATSSLNYRYFRLDFEV